MKMRFSSVQAADIGRLRSLRPHFDIEFHILPFFEILVVWYLDGGVVCVQVVTAVFGRDESIALATVKPPHKSCCHAKLQQVSSAHSSQPTRWDLRRHLSYRTPDRLTDDDNGSPPHLRGW